MMPTSTADVVELRFPSFLAWLLTGFAAVMLVLGIFIALPRAKGQKGQDVPVGLAIAGASALGIVGGLYWLKHLPVMVRLRRDSLEVVFMDATFRWADLEDVEVVAPNKHATFVCLTVRPEAKARYADDLGGIVNAAAKDLCGDYDIFLSNQRIGMDVFAVEAEIKQRIARAAS